MNSLKGAIGLIPRNFYVIKIGTTMESLRTEESVLKRCAMFRGNLENDGLVFAKKSSLLFATREEAEQHIDSVEKKPPPVFIIIDDYDARTTDPQLAHECSVLHGILRSAVRGRCSAFVNAMIKLWSDEAEKNGKSSILTRGLGQFDQKGNQ